MILIVNFRHLCLRSLGQYVDFPSCNLIYLHGVVYVTPISTNKGMARLWLDQSKKMTERKEYKLKSSLFLIQRQVVPP